MNEIVSKTGKKFEIRLPKLEDLEELFVFASAIEQENTFILLNPDEPLTIEEEEEYLKDLINEINKKKKLTYLVLDEGKIIGSCDVSVQGKRQNHVGKMGISVLPDYRSDGIGKRLMEQVMEDGKRNLGITQFILSCFANNKPAQGLYKSMGFEEHGRHPRAVQYKGELIDEVLYHKD